MITFNGSAFQAEVQAVMRAITFANTSDNPSTARRTVSMTLTDGDGGTSNTAVRSIDVVASNDAPVMTASRTTVSYTEGGAPAVVDNRIVVSDVDSADFSGGRLTVTAAVGGQSSDRFGIQASGPVSVNSVTKQVLYNGTVIGVYAGTTTFIITFNGNASAAKVQEVARRIVFWNISNAPSTTPRQISFRLTDGDGGTSAVATKPIIVTRRN